MSDNKNENGAQGASAKAPRLRRLRISDISVGNRLLDINEDNVLALMNSITDVGLIQPIAVSYYYGRGYGVKVGAHRLEAHKRLGLKEIDAVIIDLPGRKGMLAEIDENLIRRDLTDAERAKLTAERKSIYELDHPKTKHGGDRKGSTRQNGDLKRFTEDTAEKTGRSERSVQRDAARGEALGPDVLDKVKGTVLDKGAELDALARLPEDEQRALAERAKAGEQVSAKVAKVEETQAPTETDVAEEKAPTLVDAFKKRMAFAWTAAKQDEREQFVNSLMAEVETKVETPAQIETTKPEPPTDEQKRHHKAVMVSVERHDNVVDYALTLSHQGADIHSCTDLSREQRDDVISLLQEMQATIFGAISRLRRVCAAR